MRGVGRRTSRCRPLFAVVMAAGCAGRQASTPDAAGCGDAAGAATDVGIDVSADGGADAGGPDLPPARGCAPREISGGYGKGMAGVRGDGSGVAWGGGAIPGPVRHVETRSQRVCALFEDGSITCWAGSLIPMLSLAGPFQGMAMGQAFVCGLRTDGTVGCFATDGVVQQFPVPAPPAGRFTRLVSNADGVCGLQADGGVACTSVGPPSTLPDTTPSGPFVDLIMVQEGACGLRPDGTFQCWPVPGDSSVNPNWPVYSVPKGRYTSIAFSTVEGCGLLSDGTVVCWDYNGPRADTPSDRFTQIVAGDYGTCGIRTDGSVLCWGELGDATAPADFACCGPDFSDDFSTDPQGRWGEILDTWAWSSAEGTFSVVATGSTGSTDATSYLLPHHSAWANVEIDAVLKVDAGSDGGLLFRSSGNAYYVGLYPTEQKIRLRYLGVSADLAEADADVAYGEYHRIGVSAIGCALAVSLDGVPVLAVTDAVSSGGTVGLLSNGGSVTIDSITVHCAGGSSCIADPSSPIP